MGISLMLKRIFNFLGEGNRLSILFAIIFCNFAAALVFLPYLDSTNMSIIAIHVKRAWFTIFTCYSLYLWYIFFFLTRENMCLCSTPYICERCMNYYDIIDEEARICEITKVEIILEHMLDLLEDPIRFLSLLTGLVISKLLLVDCSRDFIINWENYQVWNKVSCVLLWVWSLSWYILFIILPIVTSLRQSTNQSINGYLISNENIDKEIKNVF